MDIIIVIMYLLHLLATIAWIGAMVMLLFVIIPCAKHVLGPSATLKELMKSIGERTTSLVNVSILVLILTGIILAIFAKSSATWSQVLMIKHAVVFVMVAIHLSRNKVIAPKLEKIALRTQQVNHLLGYRSCRRL
jgi:uncharacterized membrane protein